MQQFLTITQTSGNDAYWNNGILTKRTSLKCMKVPLPDVYLSLQMCPYMCGYRYHLISGRSKQIQIL